MILAFRKYKISLKIVVFALLFLLSLELFISAPKTYIYSFNLLCFIIFIVTVVLFFIFKAKKNYFDFETIFIISYFFVFYVYPVLLYPINPQGFFMFAYGFNYDVISRGTALTNLGIVSMMLGSFVSDPDGKPLPKIITLPLRNNLTIGLVFLFFALFLTQFDLSVLRTKYTGEAVEGIPGYILLILAPLVLSAIIIEFRNLHTLQVKGIKDFLLQFDKKLMFIAFTITGFFLVAGYRTLALQIMLMTLALFALFIRPIDLKTFLILIFTGIILMALLTRYRTARSDFSLDEALPTNALEAGLDLIINNRNLYVAIDYADKNGFAHGMKMTGNIIAPIPFLQSILIRIFGLDPDTLTTSKFFTYLALGRDSSLGLGTNIIGDIYINFGTVGVIIFMFILGYLVNLAKKKGEAGSFYYLLFYGIMASYSVYLVRAEFFFFLRVLFWAVLISWFIRRFRIIIKPEKLIEE